MRKSFLSVNRTSLTVDRLNLSFRIEGFQRVEGFPFLTTKNPKADPPPERVPTAQAKAADVGSIFKNTVKRRSATNRLYFAEQIPQVAKSQAERRTLPKEEGIQDKGSSQPIRQARNHRRRPPGKANAFIPVVRHLNRSIHFSGLL